MTIAIICVVILIVLSVLNTNRELKWIDHLDDPKMKAKAIKSMYKPFKGIMDR